MAEDKIIVLRGIKKFSMNTWMGAHWGTKASLKRKIQDLVYKQKLPNEIFKCEVKYDFYFDITGHKKLFDCTNCAAMIKNIEDALFSDDAPLHVKKVTITSQENVTRKADDVVITIKYL